MEDVSKNLNKYGELANYYSCIYHIPPDEGLVDKFVWQACHCGCAGIPFVNSPSPSIYLPLTSQPSKFTLKRRPKIKLLYAFDLTLEPKEKEKTIWSNG